MIQPEVLHEECLHIREAQCTRKLHYTWIFNSEPMKTEKLIASPIANRLVDVDTGSTYIFICAKRADYKCAWSTAYKYFYKLKSL